MKNALIFAAMVVAGVYSQNASADFVLTCESSAGQTRSCPVNSGGKVYLQTQLSRAGCFEGQSWGTYDRTVWVSNGCRATFRVSENNYDSYNNRYGSNSSTSNGKAAAASAAVVLGAIAVAAAANKNNSHGSYSNDGYNDRYGNNYGGYGNQNVTCESQDNRRQTCQVYIGRGSVQISRKLSQSACRFGQDWDYDRNSIYVWNGCRAIFSIR